MTKKTNACEICREKYSPTNSGQRFCSRKCFGKWMSTQTGEKSKNWKGGGEEFTCNVCNEDFRMHRTSESQGKYCSIECKSESFSGKGNPNWSGGREVECSNCGDSFYLSPFKIERSENVFCSHECWGKYQSEGGEVGTKTERYGENWDEWREWVRKRDGYQCYLCEVPEDKTDTQLDVHHIFPVKDFSNPKYSNTPENLVSLCRSCHIICENNEKINTWLLNQLLK